MTVSIKTYIIVTLHCSLQHADINLVQSHLPLTLKKAVELTNSITQWFLLGVRLGVPFSKLKEIEHNYPRDIQRCRCEVLQTWLHGGYEVETKVAELVKVVNRILAKDTSRGKLYIHGHAA